MIYWDPCPYGFLVNVWGWMFSVGFELVEVVCCGHSEVLVDGVWLRVRFLCSSGLS